MENSQDDKRRQAHYTKMTTTPVPRLVSSLALPTIISMLVTSIYSMADTFFVAQLGTSAAGAVGIVFSVMAIIQAIGFTLGQGGGAFVSRLLGARRVDEAIEAASSAFFASLFIGLVLAIFGLTFTEPLMRTLGATETILPYARAYGEYIFYAAPIMCASVVLNNLLRSEGKAMLGMVGITVGGVLNIFLDPVFIFLFDFKTAGAAMATAISQTISFTLLLAVFLRGKSNVRLRITKVSRRISVYTTIIKNGFPSFARQGLATISSVALNVSASGFGDAAVAAMSISGRITFLLFSAMLGFGQGFQPVAGFNWGAKRYDRVKQATIFTAISGTVIISTLALICFVFAKDIVRCFRRDDLEVIRIGSVALKVQCCALPFCALSVITNMALQVTGHSLEASFTSMLRQGICFLPYILILPKFIGLLGVEISQPLSDITTFLISINFFFWFLRKTDRKIKEQC
ncbi:MAG: MATE family efflux transporter [Sphaerochaetaceae bacterium]|nr:MATE family efflux transporter [Sphaerochaetaceae bacterium]